MDGGRGRRRKINVKTRTLNPEGCGTLVDVAFEC